MLKQLKDERERAEEDVERAHDLVIDLFHAIIPAALLRYEPIAAERGRDLAQDGRHLGDADGEVLPKQVVIVLSKGCRREIALPVQIHGRQDADDERNDLEQGLHFPVLKDVLFELLVEEGHKGERVEDEADERQARQHVT